MFFLFSNLIIFNIFQFYLSRNIRTQSSCPINGAILDKSYKKKMEIKMMVPSFYDIVCLSLIAYKLSY